MMPALSPSAFVDRAGERTGAARRVLLVTYEFPPSLEIGAQACSQLARYLPLHGWQPVVLTVDARYFPRVDPRLSFAGRVVRTGTIPHPLSAYAAVRGWLRSDHGRPLADQRPYSERSAGELGTVRRWVLSLLKTPDEYTGWIAPAIVAGLKAIRRECVDHICSSAPCWSNHLVALALSRLTGLPWTAHFRDPWTGIPQWKPVSALSARIESALERLVVTRASTVVCVTDAHADLLRRLHPGMPAAKFVTIPNGFDPAEWEDAAASARDGEASRGPFVVTYAGSLYARRNPLPVIRALKGLIEAGAVRREDVRVDLIGACDVAEGQRLEESVSAAGMRYAVVFTGPLGRAETLRRMAGSALLLLLAEAQPLQIPGKAYEYLRAGRPILAVTSEGAVARLLRRTGGALVVEPGDDDGIAKALREVYRRWLDGDDGPTADAEVLRGFDRRLLAGRLADVFGAACGLGTVRGRRRGERRGA